MAIQSNNVVLTPVESLFKRAFDNGKAEFIFTLVRVDGMYFGRKDAFKHTEDLLVAFKADTPLDEIPPAQAVTVLYNCKNLCGISEIFDFLFNLLVCLKGEQYTLSPFAHLGSGHFPSYVPPTLPDVLQALHSKAVEVDEPQLTDLTATLLAPQLLTVLTANTFLVEDSTIIAQRETRTPVDTATLADSIARCVAFYRDLVATYTKFRIEFKKLPRFYKWRNFMVCELLVSDDVGLYGFKVHHSNGSPSTYERGPDSSQAINLSFHDGHVQFWAGDLDALKPEWRVGEKRLCEIGLTGRYNEPGTWKPIVYPGETDIFQKEIFQATTDERVQGVLFYMYCTGHRGIEFAARTTVELPAEGVVLPPGIHLVKCEVDEVAVLGRNMCIYDGWLELPDISVDTIKAGLVEINRALNRLGFAFNADVRWCVKYSLVHRGGGLAKPEDKDLEHLAKLLTVPTDDRPQRVLDAVIDWYRRGRSSADVFNAYLCYWIALESLAVAFFDGLLGAHYTCAISDDERRAAADEARDDIQILFEALYSTDPVGFIVRAYHEAIPDSIAKKTKSSLRAVFGDGSSVLSNIYTKKDGYSLADIRHQLAHGRFSGWDFGHEDVVRNRIGEVAMIAKEFIVRVLLGLSPSEAPPTWTGMHTISFSASDPRSILVVSREDMLPSKDWRIRPEWIE